MFDETQELDGPEAAMAEDAAVVVSKQAFVEQPVFPQLDPADDDIIAAAEDDVRKAIIAHADQCIAQLTEVLKKSPKAAARVLHLIRNVAETQSQMLVSLGVGTKVRKRRRHGIYSMGQGIDIGSSDDFEMGQIGGGAEYSPGGETFGNQALKQVIAAFQPIAAAALTQRNAEAEQRKLSSVNELTQAVSVAREKGLPPEITTALQDKLKELLKPAAEGLAAPILAEVV
jgi:hypothetical protein